MEIETSIYIHMYVFTNIYVHTYICIHTHIIVGCQRMRAIQGGHPHIRASKVKPTNNGCKDEFIFFYEREGPVLGFSLRRKQLMEALGLRSWLRSIWSEQHEFH